MFYIDSEIHSIFTELQRKDINNIKQFRTYKNISKGITKIREVILGSFNLKKINTSSS